MEECKRYARAAERTREFPDAAGLRFLQGALLTVILLAGAVDRLMTAHYSLAFHGILGIVAAATLVIVPFGSLALTAAAGRVNLACIGAGAAAALALDRFNRSVKVPAL